MMTDNMQLVSIRDARVWVNNMGFDFESEEQEERLVKWIWDNAPYYPCIYADHPVYRMSIDDVWAIVDVAQ